MSRKIVFAILVLGCSVANAAVPGEETSFGPADPQAKDSDQFDARRPVAREMQASVPDGFSVAAVGDLIISRPLSQYSQRLPAFAAVLEILRSTDVTVGNLETTIFDPRGFKGAPYSFDGDWTNASVPAVAADLRAMGFDIVGRANNHSQDWGLEGMRETAHWLDKAGIAWAGAGDSHRMARAPAYFESPAGRVGLVSLASTFRPSSESLPEAATSPGRPGLSALHVSTIARVPDAALESLAAVQCQLFGKYCDDIPAEGQLFGTRYRKADSFYYEHGMDSDDLAEILKSIRSAQQNADFVVVAIHSHECSRSCDEDGPRGPADFLKQLAHEAIDSGADMFFVTGNHNLGPVEVYRSARGYRPIFYGLGNFFWSDVQELLPQELFRANRELLSSAWKRPDKATEYDLTAPLNKGYFAHEYTFQSVIADVRFENNGLSRIVLHPVELGYGSKLTESGVPRLVSDASAAKEIFRQIADRTRQFGLPALNVTYTKAGAVILPPAD